jgi:hypothetical protein
MRLTVLADEAGEVIGAMGHPWGEPRRPEVDPEGIRVVPAPGQVAVTVDAPDELAGRELDAEYFETLRGYVVRDGGLVKREQ